MARKTLKISVDIDDELGLVYGGTFKVTEKAGKESIELDLSHFFLETDDGDVSSIDMEYTEELLDEESKTVSLSSNWSDEKKECVFEAVSENPHVMSDFIKLLQKHEISFQANRDVEREQEYCYICNYAYDEGVCCCTCPDCTSFLSKEGECLTCGGGEE